MRTTQRRVVFGKGGKDKMFKPQAAGPAKPGRTGKVQTAAPGEQGASSGTMARSGGLASPAPPSRTGPSDKIAGQSTRNYSKGGLARPAVAGRCAPE